jgi:hypothetical protein
MFVDRSVRSLGSLGGASTSRVLNLLAIALTRAEDPEHAAKPLFCSPVFNRSILLRHRVRGDETYLFHSRRSVATKIIVPFDERDLKLGGRSFFVDQRGYQETVQQIGNYKDGVGVERDLEVLRLIDAVPSLDPFLLREHLRMNEFDVGSCYFEISAADRKRMYDFVAGNIQSLIQLAMGGSASNSASTSKLVSALLSSEVDEKLDPLRLTLGLQGAEFREGVFSWRGFLYYKWSMNDFWPQVNYVLRQVRDIRPTSVSSPELGQYINDSKRRIIQSVKQAGHDVGGCLKTYDNSYAELVSNGNPQAFRDFLLRAPHMFLDLGEKIGGISHIVSFWNYRFPRDQTARADAEELTAIFQDFESSVGLTPQPLAIAS